MKTFFSNAAVHVVVVAIFGILTQWLTSSGVATVTVSTIVHTIYEAYLSYTTPATPTA